MTAVSGGKHRELTSSVRAPLAVPRRLLQLRPDAVLAQRAAGGDETAFEILYERHRPLVLAVCMGVLGSAHDAEDATQETFAALSIALANKIPPELRPWLIRVARNASIDTTRRRKHRLLTFDGELPEPPVRASAAKAEFELVMDGIRELPEQQRTALLMRELGGHSYAEIADFMELEEAAVRGLIARARVGLRGYREATELPCATARACIETEPDGRRYDKTIRRHLRGCAACRSYRAALRGDAKALRGALPFQTGAFSTTGGGLLSGALSAGKAALAAGGATQLAATCAASVCAVGAVGGIALIAPGHRLLAKPVLAPPATPHHQGGSRRALVSRSTVVPIPTHAKPQQPSATGVSHKSTVEPRRARRHGAKLPLSAGPTGTPTETGIRHITPTPVTAVHRDGSTAPAVTPVQIGTPPSTGATSCTAAPTSNAGAGTSIAADPVGGAGANAGVAVSGGANAGVAVSGAANPSAVGPGVVPPGVVPPGAVNPGAVTSVTSATVTTPIATVTTTISTPTVPAAVAPVTNTDSSIVHDVASGLAGQSSPASTTQSTTTPAL